MKNKQINKKYKFAILRPGGNDTMLIKGIVIKPLRKSLNNLAMRAYPNIEQVGFYSFDQKKKIARLGMAGGEFCGNALRSLAYLLLNGKKGEIKFKVSGTKRILKAGVNKKATAYAQMPIIKSFESVKQLNQDLWLVDLEGISFLINRINRQLLEIKAKALAKKLLKENNLLCSRPAAGVIFIKKRLENEFDMQPVVWVRDIKTFFYETACASGTAAIGLWISLQNDKPNIKINVKQPSKKYIQVKVRKNNQRFLETYIEGAVEILQKEGVLPL